MSEDIKETKDHGEEGLSPEEESSGEAVGESSESLKAENETAPEAVEESPLESAQREAKEHYDKLLRVYADFENYKKRMERDRAELIKYANEGLLRELLPVIDNLDRAVEEARKNSQAEDLVQGMEMILKQFMDTLEKSGVKSIPALGEPFDPNLHEAMMHEVSEEHDDHTVIDEFQQGYLLKDRLLRPSMVKVSKKPEKNADVGVQEEE